LVPEEEDLHRHTLCQVIQVQFQLFQLILQLVVEEVLNFGLLLLKVEVQEQEVRVEAALVEWLPLTVVILEQLVIPLQLILHKELLELMQLQV
tara:strand:- start:362 stop:640 length:279 start_codon:yes stop_codon:yes gene_type:complete